MIPHLEETAGKAGVNPGLILGAALFVATVILLLFQGFEICVTAFTVIYPGLLSIRAIESPEKNDDKVWLTYWIVFGFLHVVETFLGFVLYFVPYYSWLRVAFFVYLIQFNGAETLYTTVLKDLLAKNKDLIKDLIKRAQDATSSVAKQAAAAASDPTNIMKAAQVASNV